MNKEKVLEMSRQENKDKDLFELEVGNKATQVGSITSVSVCAILYVA